MIEAEGEEPTLPERHLIGDLGWWIELRDVANDGRERWDIFDANGMLHSHEWGKEEAERRALDLTERMQA